jgi:uncharacterized protein (DUF885 family)
MKTTLLVGICAVVLSACGGSSKNTPAVNNPPPVGPTAAEQFAADLQGLSLADFFDTSFEVLSRRSPETIIWRSLSSLYPSNEALLDDLSDDFQRDTFEMYQVALDALRSYDRSVLDAEGQLNFDVYEWQLQDVADRADFLYHGFPATYSIFGVQEETRQLFTEVHPLQTLQDAEDYIARLNRVGVKFTQLAEHLQLQRQAGVVEPALTMQVAINQVQAMAQGSAALNPYYTNFVTKIAAIPGITSGQRDDLEDRAFTAVDRVVKNAYQQLLQTLQGLLNNAPPSIGVGQYDRGSDYYDYALRHHTTTDMTPAEIHQLGLDELVRIHAEMRLVFDQLGYPQNETLQQLFARVQVGGGIIPAASVLSTYETIIDLAEQNVDAVFDIFPSADVVVIPDDFGGFYIGPSADGTRPGAFYAGTTTDQPWFQMRSLSYHEAVPGHHTQIAIAMDQDLPVFRKVGRATAFVEGWALYAERLAFELGWHGSDPYSNLGRLQYEALRATRLVMDTGIHSFDWSFDQAAQFNAESIGASIGSSRSAAGRYSVWPGQATAYMVGMLQILSERQRAMDALGAQFDLKGFHRALLTNGALPLALMDTVVDQYIADTLATP